MSAGKADDPPDGHARLEKIASRLRAGATVGAATVRDLLHWFGANRRGRNIVFWIQQTLYECDLQTEPDFRYAYLDGPIEFRLGKNERDSVIDLSMAIDLNEAPEPSGDKPPSAEVIVFPGTEPQQSRPVTTDPTYRIGKLTSANTRPVSVKPNDSLAIAMTLMLANDFWQLPVMTNERDVKGVVSWESIGARLAVGRQCQEVRECMDEAIIISDNTSFFDAIPPIIKSQYVLVRDTTNQISGIVTASDLSTTFRELAEPFLLLDEIENHIRSLVVRSEFTIDQLKSAADEGLRRDIKTVFDLTIGEYIRACPERS